MDWISDIQGKTRKKGLLMNSYMYLVESCMTRRTVKLSSEDSVLLILQHNTCMLRVRKVKRYPFLLVSVRNSIVNYVNLLTCEQESLLACLLFSLTKTCLEPFVPYCISFQDISSSIVLLDAFHKWICSVCSRDTPLLLCSGMLLTCDIPQGRLPAFQICTDN